MLHLAADAFVSKEKALEVLAEGQASFTPHNPFAAAADFLEGGELFAELVAALVDVIEASKLAGLDAAFGGRDLADDGPQQRGFSKAIAAGDADTHAVFEGEVEAAKERAVAEGDAEIDALDDAIAERRWWRNAELDFLFGGGVGLRGDLIELREADFGLRALGGRAASDPFEFAAQKHLALVFDGRIASLALGLGEEVIGVIAFVREEAAVGQLDHAPGHAIEEIAVVRDDEVGTGEAFQELGDPIYGFGVEVVRGFVQDQEIGPGDNRAGHGHAAFLAAGKGIDAALGIGAIEMGESGFNAAIKGPAIERDDTFLEFSVAAGFGGQGLELRDAMENMLGAGANFFVNGLLRIERELLRKVTDHEVPARRDGAAVRPLQTGDHFEEGGLARTVSAYHPDAVVVFKGEGCAVEHDLRFVTDHEVCGNKDGRHAAGRYTRND